MMSWLDTAEYPFARHYLDLTMGRMHYVDEGDAEHAVVMVHGNPAWSFTYRRLIRCLSATHRCIAPDHIGFGLSDKPWDWEYLPESHAANLERLLEHLNPAAVTLVVGDWGGPIGLAYAIRHPQRIASLVITNSWMWPVNGDPHFEMFSRLMGGPIGRTLIRRYNFFVKVLMHSMFRSRIAPNIHRHYIEPLARPDDRKGCWVFPRQFTASSAWLSSLWEARAAIAGMPALIVWGKKDIAFREVELKKWQSVFRHAEVLEFEGAGHFVQEDLGDSLCQIVAGHLRKALPPAASGKIALSRKRPV